MQLKSNLYLRSEIKELMKDKKYLLVTKILKKMKPTKDDPFEVKYFIYYNLAFSYIKIGRNELSQHYLAKAEDLFTKEDDALMNILYQNYDYKKLMKLKEELIGRMNIGEINYNHG